jgi:prevent-host-death family protein
MKISAAEFKARCLKLMDEVAQTRKPIVITKRGKAVAQMIPVPAESDTLFGYMKGTVRFQEDVVAPLEEPWSALAGDEDHLYRSPRRRPKSGARRRPAARKGKVK